MKIQFYCIHWVKMNILMHSMRGNSGGVLRALLVGDGRVGVFLCLLACDEHCVVTICIGDDFTQPAILFSLIFYS